MISGPFFKMVLQKFHWLGKKGKENSATPLESHIRNTNVVMHYMLRMKDKGCQH